MDDELVERALDLYRDAAWILHRQGIPVWQELDLTMAQARMLFALTDKGPMPIGRLARQLSVGLPAASSLVDRLVEQRLAERREDEQDRRRTLAGASAAGEALVHRLRQGNREVLRSLLERLEPVRLEALVSGLEALVERAEQERVAVGAEV